MEFRRAVISRGVLCIASTVGVGWLMWQSMTAQPARGQEEPVALAVFSSPSHVAPGENWVLLGSFEDLPEDVAVTAAADDITVLEVQEISKRALAVRVQAATGAAGELLRASSPSAANEVNLSLKTGNVVPPLSEDANFTDEDFISGSLFVGGPEFIYAYYPATDVPLAALRIHNRTTGLWHCHETAQANEEAVAKLADQAPLADPAFVEEDPFVTLPDTDGDGILDFDEVDEGRPMMPEQLGVMLGTGLNVLDIVAVDEAGNASWKILLVTSLSASSSVGF